MTMLIIKDIFNKHKSISVMRYNLKNPAYLMGIPG